MATLIQKKIIWILLLLQLDGYPGRTFYCRPKNGLIIHVGRSTNIRQPDYLVFEEDLKPEPLNSQWRRCSWVLKLDALAPRQVVLKVIQRSSLSDGRQRRSIRPPSDHKFQLSGLTSNKCENQVEKNISLSLNTFLLFSLNTRDQLTLSKNLPRERHSLSIAVSPMEPGYCAQDMVLHGGKCHQVIEQRNSSLTEAMKIISSSISGGLQLASFTSLQEITSFVKTNYEPEDDLPPKQPLDLTKPVRIGLFYSKSANSVFESLKTGNGCEMRKLRNSDEFVSAAKSLDGPCGALQAMNSESAVVLFVSCDYPMPSLISFPETPQNTICMDCNRKIDEWLGDERLQGSVLAIVICRCQGHHESNSLSMDRSSEIEEPRLIKNLLDEQCSSTNSQLLSRNSSSASQSSSDSTPPLIVSKVQSKAEVTGIPTTV